MSYWQVRVAFPGGGRMTFGVTAATREEAAEIAGLRLAGLGGAETEIVPLDGPGDR
jgi:hypothetical protein